MPYDAAKDFAPIILLATLPNLLVVNPSLPATNVKELIALAKTKPGELEANRWEKIVRDSGARVE